MKDDSALMMIVFLAVVLAVLAARGGLFSRFLKPAGSPYDFTPALQSTGDPILDQVYADYPDLDPRRK